MSSAALNVSPAPMGIPVSVDGDDGVGLFDLIDLVIDYRWLIASCVVFFGVIGVSYALLTPSVYEADMLIQVEDNKGDPMQSLLGGAGSLFDIKSPTTAEIEILRSRLVLSRAVESLKWDVVAEPKYVPIVGRWLSKKATEPSDPSFLGVYGAEAINVAKVNFPTGLFGKKFKVVVSAEGFDFFDEDGFVGKGKVGEVFKFKSDGYSGNILISGFVGKVGAQFIFIKKSVLEVTEEVQKVLKLSEQGRQSGLIRAALEGYDPVLVSQFLNEVGNIYVRQNTNRKSAEAEKSIDFLNQQLPEVKKALQLSEVGFNKFRQEKGTFDLSEEAKQMLEQSVALQVRLIELQQKKSELEARFTGQHPSVQVVDGQIKEIKSQIGSISNRSQIFPKIEQDLVTLTRDVKVNSELYTSLLNSLQQLRLVKEGKVGNVRIVDFAVTPEKSTKPQRLLLSALSVIIGFMLGIFIAFIRNKLNPGIGDSHEIEHHLGLNVFANIPHSEKQSEFIAAVKSKKPGKHLLAIQYPDDPVIESLRSLRTALQFAMLDASNKLVLLTGPTPGIGKSFVSANFAAVAAVSGKKVLLIDADIRKGYINQYFGLKRGYGLTDLILGTKDIESVLHKDVGAGLDFISTGTMPPNPAEVLNLPSLGKLLKHFNEIYDLIVIDTPPVLAVSDTAVIAPLVGTVFLVARAEMSTLGEVQESSKRLLQAGVKAHGVIFNDLTVNKRRYGYGYGYKYSRYRYKQYQYNSTN